MLLCFLVDFSIPFSNILAFHLSSCLIDIQIKLTNVIGVIWSTTHTRFGGIKCSGGHGDEQTTDEQRGRGMPEGCEEANCEQKVSGKMGEGKDMTDRR